MPFPKFALPVAGLILCLIAAAAMLAAGADLWLVLGVTLLWLGSLWLGQPEPEEPAERHDLAAVSRDAVHETIEPLGQPLLLLDGTRIADANAAARAALGAHVLGQDARIALRHPDAMRLIGMGHNDSVTIHGFTGAKSLWQLTRRNLDETRWIIELADRSSEADVSRAHTDFVANASHELRTPLAAITGYVETLSEGSVDENTRKRFLSIVQREAQRMQNLVEDLMTLSHVEAEKHDRPSQEIDLGRLAARVVGEVSSLQGKERVEVAGSEPGAIILGDATQLEQVLRNLIDNALKYADPDQPVRVSVSRNGGRRIKLAVIDRGPGIAPEHLPHLTRRFYRTDPGRSRASGGTGLGLAIVKHIVERHSGELDIASTLGEGTTITLAFPVAPSDD
ncbi:MAG: two-component sensor histidine kinase [Novosphingobium sp.]|nr:two-component sensor histidine kinase [Novosphingobium sp.]MBP6555271.1 two-component sensor histidine kinase [Novosphingobium sp.]